MTTTPSAGGTIRASSRTSALALDPAAAVLHYGQAMFEGLKAFRSANGKVQLFRVDRHCRRMAEGAGRLCMPPVDIELMREAILALVRVDSVWVPSSTGTSLYLRPTLIATEPFLGVRPSKRYLFFLIASPVGPYTGEAFAPARIWVEDKYTRAAPGGLGGVKAGANYVASLLAAEEAKKRGYAQVLWTDAGEHRSLEEVGTMNMVVRIKDEFVTPPLEGTILGGVTRDSIITLLREWGFRVSERRHRHGRDHLGPRARRSARAVRLRHCGGDHAGRRARLEGRVAGREQRPARARCRSGCSTAITDIQYGRAPDPHEWMTAVD